MSGRLKNKKIVIIGGSSGIGLSAAKAFIREGAYVMATGKEDEYLATAQETLGKNASVIALDAIEPGTAMQAIDRCVQEFGGFDGLFHVAGGSGRKWGDGPLHELTGSGWNQTIELNLSSVVWSNQAAVKKFLELKKGGTILNLGSVLGSSPSPKFFPTHAYAAAKAGIIGFSKSIAAYYAADNIRVNVMTPALVDTPMAQRAMTDEKISSFIRSKQPLEGGRYGRAGDLDGLAIYFMSEESAFTTGQVIAVDGGWEISEGQYNV